MSSSINVELPTGSSSGSLIFAGAPPVLKAIDANSSLSDVPLNWYAQTLLVENVEYSCISDTVSLKEALQSFSSLSRTLVLQKEIMVGPPMVALTLPVGKNTGIELDGFPPVVTNVDKNSSMHGKVPVGYVVDRLILPDKEELSLASGGFTASNVNRALLESSHQEGRVLVLKKVTPKGDVTSSSRPFDFGSFTNQSKWSIGRMFGTERKVVAVKKGAVKSLD